MNQGFDANITPRQLRRYIITGALLITIGLFALWYFSNSWIYITTKNDDAVITLYRNNNVIKEGKGGSLFTAVAPGEYTVQVTTKKGAAARFEPLHAGEFATMTVTPPTRTNVSDDVAAQNIYTMSASSSRLSYITATQQNGFHTITSSGEYENAEQGNSFETIDWLNPDFGATIYRQYGQIVDPEPKIGVISGTNLTTYTPPASLRNTNSSIKATKDSGLVITIGKTVYTKSPDSSEFKAIYNGKRDEVDILSARDAIIVYDYAYNNEEEALIGSAVAIDANGKQINTVDNLLYHPDPTNVPTGEQSPSGKYVAILIGGRVSIYSPTLQLVAHIPQPEAVYTATWTDDDTLLFASKNIIWQYKMGNESKVATSLAFDRADHNITSLAVDPVEKFAYFSSTGKSSNDTLRRVSYTPENRNLPVAAVKLTQALPYSVTLAMCQANYLNFGKPTVLIEKYDEPNKAQSAANMQACNDEVRRFLRDDQKIDIDTVNFTSRYTTTLGQMDALAN